MKPALIESLSIAALATSCIAIASAQPVREPLPLDVVTSLRTHNSRSPVNLSPDGEWLAHAVVTEFVAPSEGRPRQIRVTGAGPKPFVSEQVAEEFAPTATELREYVGRYTNADLSVTYELVARASGLVVQIPGRTEIALQPVFPDAFYGSLVDLIKFSRDAGPKPTAFTINRTSVRNLRFERIR